MSNKLKANENLKELSPEELDQVNGGSIKDLIDVVIKIINPK